MPNAQAPKHTHTHTLTWPRCARCWWWAIRALGWHRLHGSGFLAYSNPKHLIYSNSTIESTFTSLAAHASARCAWWVQLDFNCLTVTQRHGWCVCVSVNVGLPTGRVYGLFYECNSYILLTASAPKEQWLVDNLIVIQQHSNCRTSW